MKRNIKILTTIGLLSSVALIIFVIEGYLPPLGIPGAKLGLSNIVVLFTMMYLGRKQAFAVLIIKITLGSIFSLNPVGFLFSIFGGLLAFCVMSVSSKFFYGNRLFITSILGAVVHNLGQLVVAYFVMNTQAVFFYTPYLMFAGILTGLFTGISATAVLKIIKK